MFGRDPVLPLNTLLEPKVRYMGSDMNVLSLEALKNMYEIAATNLKMAREKKDSPKDHKPSRCLVFSGTVHWFEGRQAFIHYCGLHQV